MIWYDIKELEKQLVDGSLSEKEGFNYLLANMILFSVIPYLVGDRSDNYWLTLIQFVVDIFITVILVRATFDINNNGDNQDYFKRFLGLSFVTTVRLFIYLLIVLLILEIVMHFVDNAGVLDKNTKEIFWLLLEIATGIVYYFMLTNSFKRVNEKRQ
jgi:uncharacterized membrane protein HdeD (DUF308 family)